IFMKKKTPTKKVTSKKRVKKLEVNTDVYDFKSHNTLMIKEKDAFYRTKLGINFSKTCDCKPTHINCLTASQWIKHQLGVWEFYYEKRDIRNRNLHPATFPLSLAKKIIELFSHQGELVLDPFVGSGTTLLAAQDTNRNSVGFDLQQKYIELSYSRLNHDNFFNSSKQIAIQDDARN